MTVRTLPQGGWREGLGVGREGGLWEGSIAVGGGRKVEEGAGTYLFRCWGS